MQIFPSKKRVLFYGFVLVLGIAIGSGSEHKRLVSSVQPISEALIAQRISELRQPTLQDLEAFFDTAEPGLVFVYAPWDTPSQYQYQALLPLMARMPSLALALGGDKPLSVAKLLASDARPLPFAPYVLSHRQVLATRNFLSSHNCRINAVLPYVALTDGNGYCIAQWQGYVDAESIRITQKTLLTIPLAAGRNIVTGP